MLLQSQIAEIIDNQQQNLAKKPASIERDLFPKIEILDNFATIITGVRRCGKSTLLQQIYQQQPTQTLFLNFEDPRLVNFDNQDYSRLLNEIQKRQPSLLLFDEIQIFPNWEIFVRNLLDIGFRMVITGSNATLLSQELGTKLTGRHLSYELFPFNYPEFLRFTSQKTAVESSEDYLQQGGFADFLRTQNSFILNQLLEDVLYRDIAVRYGIRDVVSLKKLVVYLLTNIGKEVSANSLKSSLAVKSTSTILDYFSHLQKAYLVDFIPKFSYSLKTQLRNPNKVYAIDLGLASQNSLNFSPDFGRKLENAVFLQLRQKSREIYYFQEQHECDFVMFQQNKIQSAIQVCYELNDMNLDRETSGLMEALNYFNLDKGTIVTFNQTDSLNMNDKVIEILPFYQWIDEFFA